jgi:hypothetical protein
LVTDTGRAGGILLGINLEMFTVQNVVLGDFYVKTHLKNKMDNFEWGLVAVYGAAQNEEKKITFYNSWYRRVAYQIYLF